MFFFEELLENAALEFITFFREFKEDKPPVKKILHNVLPMLQLGSGNGSPRRVHEPGKHLCVFHRSPGIKAIV